MYEFQRKESVIDYTIEQYERVKEVENKLKVRRVSRSSLCIMVILGASILTPILIHYFSPLSAGDLLAYIGSCISSIMILVGLFFTFRFERSKSREEQKHSIKPYLVSYKTDYDLLSAICCEKKNNPYIERPDYNTQYILYRIVQNTISFSYTPPSREDLTADEKDHDILEYNKFWNRFISFRYIIENVGAGSAVNVSVSLNVQDIDMNFGISVNGKREYVLIYDFNDLTTEQLHVDFELQLKFSDPLEMMQYAQYERFCVIRGEDFLKVPLFEGLDSPLEILPNI